MIASAEEMSLPCFESQRVYEYFRDDLPSCAEYQWRDAGWISFRREHAKDACRYPLNAYEVHLGSWRFHENGSSYTYAEIASELAVYAKQMGYTHVALTSLLDCMRHESHDSSLASCFVPDRRYGSPADFMSFVDAMHEAGIGVLLAFPIEEQVFWGLQTIDACRSGTGLGESFWGSDAGFLMASSILFWIEQYHIDGVNFACGESDSDARREERFSFLRRLSVALKKRMPDILLIGDASACAEESSFDLAWNRDWSSLLSAYAELDPLWRKYHHEQIACSLNEAVTKGRLLSISCSDVSHGKRSFIGKMYGDYWKQFAGVRLCLGYMMTHPGKKLLFMGTEIGQFCEWDPSKAVEWFLLEYEAHDRLKRYVSELNHFYLANAPLWQQDNAEHGFCWLDANNRDRSIFAFRRIASDGQELLIVLNFTPVVYENFRLGVRELGIYEELFNSDCFVYGGSGVVNEGELACESVPWNELPQSVCLRVPPLGIAILGRKQKALK